MIQCSSSNKTIEVNTSFSRSNCYWGTRRLVGRENVERNLGIEKTVTCLRTWRERERERERQREEEREREREDTNVQIF